MSGTGDHQNTVDRPQVKSALIQAVDTDDENEVKRLIYEGADVNKTDDQGKTPLIYAVQNDVNINIIKALVEEGKAPVNALDRYDRTSLFYTITKSTDKASYLFDKADYFDDSDLPNILSFFLESICTKSHDSHPTIDEVLLLLEKKCLKPKKLAKTIVNILLCKISLLSTSSIEIHCSSNLHPLFHLYGKRTSLLDALKKVSEESNCMKKYSKNESIKEILKMIEGKETISAILDLLKKHHPDPKFADSDGNTALHYATCLPWMGVPHETVKEICAKLQSFGVPLDKENHLGQTPLLLCLSGSIGLLEEEDAVTTMKTLVEVSKFLVKLGSMLEKTTTDGESVFHLVIKLFQQGFEISNETVRQKVIDEIMELLQLFSHTKVGQVVSKGAGDSLNSPLHLWASLELTAPDYTVFVRQNHTFEELLDDILNHLIICGARTNDTNNDDETPLHLCNTWSAVKLLINKGAHPYVVDSLKRPPLLVAACKKTFLKKPSHFYPDVQEEAKSFFTTALEKKLDPWTVVLIDEQKMSVLAVLIKSETYDLSTALVEVACTKEKDKKIFVSLLNAVCKDESMNIHWKAELAEKLLSFAKNRKLHIVDEFSYTICCKNAKNSLSTTKQETREEPENNLHCKLVRILFSYGGKSSEYSDDLEIDNILKSTRPVQALVPWTPESKTHKDVLEKVARRQEGQEIGESICCHEASAGSFGADIFVGINKLNSKEVAIKRIGEEQCTQELKNLYAKLDCEQVIRYFLHLEDTEDHFVYIVFELMEGNLDAYLNCDAFQPGKSTSLCGDIVKGLKYLHKHEIRHFQDHLKPTSIFYKTHPELCLKMTDFDHSQPAKCWMAPELWMGTHVKGGLLHSKASDMFSCGLVLHYILSKRKHPFSKNNSQMAYEIETNMTNGRMEGWGDSLSPEATNLVKNMLQGHRDKDKRPTPGESLDHPLFWSNKKKVDVLVAVGNQSEFGYPRAKRFTLTPVETDLEKNFSTIVMHGTWNDPRYTNMSPIYADMTSTKRSRNYDTHSVVELVRFIRNADAHVSESTRPRTIRKMLLEDFVILEYFPHLVMEVYKVVTDHGWDQTVEEIKYAMNN